MLSILILSRNGEGYELATRLAQEGDIVKFWVQDKDAQDTGKGFKSPQRVYDYKPHLAGADLVFFTTTGMGRTARELAKMGRMVLGDGLLQDMIEIDQTYGGQIAKLMKVKVPSSPVDGVEVVVEGWFNGLTWVYPFNYTINYSRLFEGDKGPNTESMGSIVWFSEESKLTDALFEPLTSLLEKNKYVGPLAIKVVVTQDEIYFLKFIAGVRYDTIQAFTEGLRIPLGELLYGVATGALKKMRVGGKFNISVRLSMPPWPNPYKEGIKSLRGLKVVNVPKEASRHVWLSDVMLNETNEVVMAGVSGRIGCVTARGETVKEARRRAYRTINNIKLTEDIQYREDIGISFKYNVIEQIAQLQNQDWLDKEVKREVEQEVVECQLMET